MYGESYEYANELGKQGRKNPRYISKITINRELFSRAINKIYAHSQSSGILRVSLPQHVMEKYTYSTESWDVQLSTKRMSCA